MADAKTGRSSHDADFDKGEVLSSLYRGEMIQVLAEIESGRFKLEEIEPILQRYEQSRRFRRIVMALLGR